MKSKMGFGTVLLKSLRISFAIKSVPSFLMNIFGFIMAFLPVFISKTLQMFTDAVQSYQTGLDISYVIEIFLLLMVFYLIQLIYQSMQDYYAKVDALHIQKYIKKKILETTYKVRYKYIENEADFKEKITFIDTDAGIRVANSVQELILILQNILLFCNIVIAFYKVNPIIIVVLTITCIPAAILSYYQKDEEYVRNAKWMKEGALAIHYFIEMGYQPTQQDIRHFRLYDFMKKSWRALADKYIRIKNAYTQKHVLLNSLADLLRNGVYVFILYVTIRQIFHNPAGGMGIFMLVFTLAKPFQDATTKILTSAISFYRDAQYMRDFFSLEDLEYEPDPNVCNIEEAVDDSSISYRNVSFVYPGSTKKALDKINIDIKSGEHVAIVGLNGSGKSTFVNLLCGLYDASGGEVLVANKNVKENLSFVRNMISVVFQDFGKYEAASLRDNITMSSQEKFLADEDLSALCEKIDAEDLKSVLNGWDEIVGSFNENGAGLSGGQWQKVALARALCKDSARIMILDEPTAAMDPLTEAQLYRNFALLTSGKTTILISHRLGITSLVDRILVFNGGQVVEQGTHKELMENGGLYSQMYRAQAKWYQ